eukprot:gene14487-15991_t
METKVDKTIYGASTSSKSLLCLTSEKKRTQHQLTLLDHFRAKIPNIHDDVPKEPSKIRNSVADTSHVAHAHADQNNLNTTASVDVKLDVNNTNIEPMIFDIESGIGNFYQNSAILSDEQKYALLTNTAKPNFACPSNSSGRKFQLKWLSDFPWLAYSQKLDGAFCLPCVLFPSNETSRHVQKLDRQCKFPFNTWSTAIPWFRAH